MSVCLSVSRSVSVCQSESLTVTVTVAAVFHLEDVTLSESVCPHTRHSPPTGVCLSESVCLSVCLSESVCLRVCLSQSRCHVTTAASAGACVPAARPPASECPRRPGRFALSESSVVPEIWLVFIICSALWPKAFRFCNFLFSYLQLRF